MVPVKSSKKKKTIRLLCFKVMIVLLHVLVALLLNLTFLFFFLLLSSFVDYSKEKQYMILQVLFGNNKSFVLSKRVLPLLEEAPVHRDSLLEKGKCKSHVRKLSYFQF